MDDEFASYSDGPNWVYKRDAFVVVHEQAGSRDVSKQYLLEDVMIKNDSKDKPRFINCDKSGMPLQHKSPKVVSKRGPRKSAK